MKQIFTVGYAQSDISTFMRNLSLHGVSAVCDVRSSPFSRSSPDFNSRDLKAHLASHSIAYVFLGKELGARTSDPSCYRHGRVDYDLLAATELFRKGLERVEVGAERFNIALMCAERDPATCHRSILVGRHLAERGYDVEHILYNGNSESQGELVKRLIKMLGMDRNRNDDVATIERFAYQVQGRRIAYQDERFADQSDDVKSAPRML